MTAIQDPRTPVQLTGKPRPPVLKALTSVRILAAVHVALYHYVRPHELWGQLAPVFRVGYVGVSFFFLLSGFILTYSHAAEYESGKGDRWRFWIARFARIYPVYLLSLLVAAYVNFAHFRQRVHIFAYVADLLMLQSWWVRLTPFFHTTAWSLSEEAFFYFLFPFILLRLLPSSAMRAWTWFFAFWALAIAVPIISLHFYPAAAWFEAPAHPEAGNHTYLIRRLPLLLAPQFFAGLSLGWIYVRFRPGPKVGFWLLLAGMGSLLIALVLSDHLPYVVLHNGLLLPCFGMIILGLSESNWLSKALSAPFLMILGEASYAVYLFHYFLVQWSPFHYGQSTIPSAFIKLAVVIPICIALHFWVERPCRRMILTWWRKRYSTTSHSA